VYEGDKCEEKTNEKHRETERTKMGYKEIKPHLTEAAVIHRVNRFQIL
jgi:hypothetical protein